MQALVWIFRLAIVLVLVWFAVRNAHTVKLNGFPDYSWEAPLVFVLLVSFVAGIVIGLLAWLPTYMRQRREIGRLSRAVERASAIAPPPATGTDIHGI